MFMWGPLVHCDQTTESSIKSFLPASAHLRLTESCACCCAGRHQKKCPFLMAVSTGNCIACRVPIKISFWQNATSQSWILQPIHLCSFLQTTMVESSDLVISF